MVKTKNFKKNLGKGLLAGALALSLAVPTFAAVDTVQEDTLSAITYEGENDSYYDENIKMNKMYLIMKITGVSCLERN